MIPPINLSYIADELERIADALEEAAEDHPNASDTDPRALTGAIRELLEALHCPRVGAPVPNASRSMHTTPGTDITALGDHCIDLLARLAALAEGLHRPQLGREIEVLTVPLACWIARCDAEIITLDPVVNGAAALANHLKQPQHLTQLYGLLREIGNAVSPLISQADVSSDPSRPWRVFLHNKAIVATRSHRPELMEDAFDALTDQLPEDASEFFREGMEQMDALDYPPEVRNLMERWHEQWCGRRILH